LTGAVEPSRGATTTQEHYGERRWQVDSQSCVLAVELIAREAREIADLVS